MGDVDICTSEVCSLKSPCLNQGDPWGGKQWLQDDAHFQAGWHKHSTLTSKQETTVKCSDKHYREGHRGSGTLSDQGKPESDEAGIKWFMNCPFFPTLPIYHFAKQTPNLHPICQKHMTLHSSIFAQINSRVIVAHLIINRFVVNEAIILSPLWNTISWVKELRLGIDSVAQLVECLPCIHRPHVWSPALYKPGLTQSDICVY